MKKVIINGKEYPCRITMGAMLRYKRMTGKDISELNNSDLESAMTLAYCCITSACNTDKVAFGMSFEDFADSLSPEDFAGFFSEIDKEQKKTPKPKKVTQ